MDGGERFQAAKIILPCICLGEGIVLVERKSGENFVKVRRENQRVAAKFGWLVGMVP